MAGMGMNDTEVPPMGPEPQMDPMAGPEPPEGGQDPMMDAPQGNGEDDELMNVVNGLSTEDKAAVLKYAKSMASEQGDVPAPDGEGMPMESIDRFHRTIAETIDSVLYPKKDRGTERDDDRLGDVSSSNPFVSQY